MQNSGAMGDGGGPAATRSRGRPRAFDRNAALETATRLFWQKGYEATSINDLVTAMGIGSPSLYAAFSSKEALYAESIGFYRQNYEKLFWGNFESAATAREAVGNLLHDSADALSGAAADIPNGCMIALSSVGSEGNERLGFLVKDLRATGLARLHERFEQGVASGEIAAAVDLAALARFVQTIYNGMSILARDGATRAELKAVADLALVAWDARMEGRDAAG